MQLLTTPTNTTVIPSEGDEVWFLNNSDNYPTEWVHGVICKIADGKAYLQKEDGIPGQWIFPLNGTELYLSYTYESFLESRIQHLQQELENYANHFGELPYNTDEEPR